MFGQLRPWSRVHVNGWGGVIHHFFLPSITTTSLILKVQLTFQIGGGRVANLQVPDLLEELPSSARESTSLGGSFRGGGRGVVAVCRSPTASAGNAPGVFDRSYPCVSQSQSRLAAFRSECLWRRPKQLHKIRARLNE